jgi:hypothetical protein
MLVQFLYKWNSRSHLIFTWIIPRLSLTCHKIRGPYYDALFLTSYDTRCNFSETGMLSNQVTISHGGQSTLTIIILCSYYCFPVLLNTSVTKMGMTLGTFPLIIIIIINMLNMLNTKRSIRLCVHLRMNPTPCPLSAFAFYCCWFSYYT